MPEKFWKETDRHQYVLLTDDNEVATMRVDYSSNDHRATFVIAQQHYHLHLTGFWKNRIAIHDAAGNTILTTEPEKWYASKTLIHYQQKIFKLGVHNNPLAELTLHDGNNLLLAYGLDTKDGRIIIRITQSAPTANLLFDCLLWYMFLPIAIENAGDTILFTMLLMQ